jgi:hypothetical protein
MLTDFFNFVIESIGSAITWILSFFPLSPFSELNTEKPEIINLGHITWFIPFPTMIIHFTIFLTAVGFYYSYRLIARWLKLVRA